MNGDQMRKLIRSPMAMMKFSATGQLPKGTKPGSALITLLEAINPGDRARIFGLVVGPELGYNGRHEFHTASNALRWIKPQEEVFGNFPADSWRIKNFRARVMLDELIANAASVPDGLKDRYPHLCSRETKATTVDGFVQSDVETAPPTAAPSKRPRP